MPSQGNYDHPSYIVRQQIQMDVTTAGANGTSASTTFLSDMRLRTGRAVVRTAGTSATTGNQIIVGYVGTAITGYVSGTLSTSTTTATLGTIVLGSSTALVTATSTDMDARLIAGGVLFLKNGTDATGVAKVCLEMNIDPGATWTGPPNG